MLDKELAEKLTDREKHDIQYHYLELLPKILANPESLYEGAIEGASRELINTLAKVTISLRHAEDSKIIGLDVCCPDDGDCCSDCCENEKITALLSSEQARKDFNNLKPKK